MTSTRSPDGPSNALRAEIATRWNAHPGMQHMGATVRLLDDGTVHAAIDSIKPHHRGGLGTDAINGAVIAGLFDLVVGLAGYQYTHGTTAGVAQLNIHYMRPVRGDRIEVVGRPTRVGRNLVFASGKLHDEQGVVCASCDGIVAVSGHSSVSGEMSAVL